MGTSWRVSRRVSTVYLRRDLTPHTPKGARARRTLEAGSRSRPDEGIKPVPAAPRASAPAPGVDAEARLSGTRLCQEIIARADAQAAANPPKVAGNPPASPPVSGVEVDARNPVAGVDRFE